MMYYSSLVVTILSVVLVVVKEEHPSEAFTAQISSSTTTLSRWTRSVSSSSSTTTTSLFHSPFAGTLDETSFIDTELRGAAMKLHTTMQSPKEGKVVVQEEPQEKYVQTHADYLQFLVDSQHVYQALEDIVNAHEDLTVFRKTGLERVEGLTHDITFVSNEYNVPIPDVGEYGTQYAEKLRTMDSIPEFICHYYNYYFAHTAGGRMIGKKMAEILLDKKVLEFYKWDGNVNTMKKQVKKDIEDLVATWTREQKDECLAGTPGAFQGGGGINRYLAGPAAVAAMKAAGQ